MKKHPLWTCKKFIKVGEVEVPLNLPAEGDYIRTNSPARKILHRILIKPYRLRDRLFVDGFIERNVGKWIKRYSKENDIILDIGCGDMRLYKYIPNDRVYYAFDISMNELFLKEKLTKKNKSLYFAFASATAIPLDSNTADIVTCTEVLDHIPEYKDAIKEILRVIKPNGLFLVSISNNFCYKYKIKGQHERHANAWSYEEFISTMKSNNFDLIEGFMMGKWVRLPLWLVKTSYQLPLSSEKECYNSYFLYAFRAKKGSG